MHPKVYKKFDQIFREYNISGRILEIGAIPSKGALLASKQLNATKKVGLNLEGPSEFEDFKIIKGNANNMKMFKSNYFDCVLCNAVLEHDKFFWKTISEIKRVLKRNGTLVIGVPSYKNYFFHKINRYILGRNFICDFLRNSTFVFKIHNDPGDYYRFSEQAVRGLFFDGFKDVKIETIMVPPRTIGIGFKK